MKRTYTKPQVVTELMATDQMIAYSIPVKTGKTGEQFAKDSYFDDFDDEDEEY